ncbi:hypothetical protein [Tardiphaga sp.]|uniref:hypothetical protein n=1 Tax=Tardiphaga sp. TaxID=1926292 RepID=UPI00260475F4|nr:hypothetical protein [Tardiphaga sp.]MDB5618335.1 hypothetical protein [Tardiphaga sp.]
MSEVSRRAQLILLKNDLVLVRNRAVRAELQPVVSLISKAITLVSDLPEIPQPLQLEADSGIAGNSSMSGPLWKVGDK